MGDLSHQWGGDLAFSSSGDLLTASGSSLSQQRLLRRLLTNPGDYIWQPDYGAGLAQFVGSPASAARIRAAVRSQIFNEHSVASTPEPIIRVTPISGNAAGTVVVDVQYVDSITGDTQVLSFSVGN